MIEIRIHGRGGMGVKKAAQILARAAYLSGFKTQDFALYGAERQGAPLTSFVRIDKREIAMRGYIVNPNYVLVLDESLPESKTLKGLEKNTMVIVNSKKSEKRKNFCSVDATGIALQETGKGIPNIAMLGALARKMKTIHFHDLEKAIAIELSKHANVVEKNIAAAKKCFEAVN